jgi:hypothetical protein
VIVQSAKLNPPALPVAAGPVEESSASQITPTNSVVPAKPKKKHPHRSKPKEAIKDPLARAALSLVGADPEAEAYWTAAINDPSLPANERQDLIEDLNEDGLTDPHHLAEADIFMIENRIELIEEQAPYAMDQVNSDAFQEAEKDLLNLLNGQTVK